MYYRLNGKIPVPCSMVECFSNYDITQRIVKQTHLPTGVFISTVFLGMDHGYGGIPELFETMVFEHDNDYMERFSTWDEAIDGHERTVQQVLIDISITNTH